MLHSVSPLATATKSSLMPASRPLASSGALPPASVSCALAGRLAASRDGIGSATGLAASGRLLLAPVSTTGGAEGVVGGSRNRVYSRSTRPLDQRASKSRRTMGSLAEWRDRTRTCGGVALRYPTHTRPKPSSCAAQLEP